MKGWLVVSDNPFGAVSKPDGTFEIAGIAPSQELEFQVWQEHIGFIAGVKFNNGTTNEQGRFKKKLTAGTNDLGTITVPDTLLPK